MRLRGDIDGQLAIICLQGGSVDTWNPLSLEFFVLGWSWVFWGSVGSSVWLTVRVPRKYAIQQRSKYEYLKLPNSGQITCSAVHLRSCALTGPSVREAVVRVINSGPMSVAHYRFSNLGQTHLFAA